MKTKTILTLGAMCGVFGVATTSQATILGFGQLGGNNTTIPVDYGSNASADANGLVVSNGATPNIALVWDILGQDDSGTGNGWDIHTSSHFGETEDLTVGGGDWDNEGGVPRIGQLDFDHHSIGFNVEAGYALVLNSFDFGNTNETPDSSTWDLTLRDSSNNIVWSQQVVLTNPDTDVITISPNFVGLVGESYVLEFDGVAGGDGDNTPRNGRHAIDNLSFNQVPEPGSVALLALGGLALLRRRK